MSYIENPTTGRRIKVGSTTYRRLKRQGQIGGYEETVLSPTLSAIKNLFFGDENVTWMKLLYDPTSPVIDMWDYFDRDYDGISQSDVEEIKRQLLIAAQTNNVDRFLTILRMVPGELIDNGIDQTISGFEREHDEIDLSPAQLRALRSELINIHNEVLNGQIRLDGIPQGTSRQIQEVIMEDLDENNSFGDDAYLDVDRFVDDDQELDDVYTDAARHLDD